MNNTAFVLVFRSRTVFLAIALLFTASSCQYFETTKVDSEELYKQEIETISWDDVDQYPLFASCDETATKDAQRLCFKEQLSKAILDNIATKQMHVYGAMLDTIALGLNISNTGQIEIANMRVDTTVMAQLPKIGDWLHEAIEKAPSVAPALKRGIPVNTSMTLPVILRSKDN